MSNQIRISLKFQPIFYAQHESPSLHLSLCVCVFFSFFLLLLLHLPIIRSRRGLYKTFGFSHEEIRRVSFWDKGKSVGRGRRLKYIGVLGPLVGEHFALSTSLLPTLLEGCLAAPNRVIGHSIRRLSCCMHYLLFSASHKKGGLGECSDQA